MFSSFSKRDIYKVSLCPGFLSFFFFSSQKNLFEIKGYQHTENVIEKILSLAFTLSLRKKEEHSY